MKNNFFIYGAIFHTISAFLIVICGFSLLLIPSVWGDTISDPENPAYITFRLVDAGQYSIERVSLMKAGTFYENGQVHQYQDVKYTKESGKILWNPCNDNACSVVSLPGSGGKTGRDELILELFTVDPSVSVDTCYGDPVCERLKGGTHTISGMVEGYFHTGKTYDISVASLKPGIGESFTVSESSQ